MDYLRNRSTLTAVLTTIVVCSFVPGLNHLGPFVLHTTAASLERTARVADHLSGYHPHVDADD
jgi:hypothetical protein